MQIVATAIAGHQSGAPDAVVRAMPAAAKFIELAFGRSRCALLGDDLATLIAEAPQAIDDAVLLLAAGGWLEDWH